LIIFKKLQKENDGYFLITTIIIMAVLLIMGSVLLNISLSEYKQSERNKDQIKAYYLARSGAEFVADSIINGDIEAEDSTFSINNKSQKIADINITEESLSNPNKKNYKIKSTAKANTNSISETVTLNLVKEEITGLFNNAIFTKGDIDLSHNNGVVTGTNPDNPGNKPSVESYNNIIGADDSIISITNSEKTMPPIPYFPEIGDENFVNDKNPSNNNVISESGYYGDIRINNGNNGKNGNGKGNNNNDSDGLVIDTTDGTPNNSSDDKDIFILLDNINLTEDITIKGEGRVSLFINNHGEFKTPNLETDQLFVFLKENATFTLQANSEFNGYIYGPDAEITMNSKWTEFKGAIVAKQLYKNKGSINGNNENIAFQGTVTYVKPPTDVNDTFDPIFTKGKWE